MKNYLEKIIDTYGIQSVLDNISSICYGKAEHLRINWQDDTKAKDWEGIAKALDDIELSKLVS